MSLSINSQEKNLHDDLIDPVSYEPMTDAVTILPCGHVLSETTATTLKAQNQPCPLDRTPIENFVANHTVRNVVIAMLGKPNEIRELKIISEETVKLGEKIGGGSFGAVHKGEWIHNPVAVKLLLDAPNDNLKASIEKEARLIASLFHPNITTFFGLLSSYKGFVMELMDESLYDAIEKGKTKTWPLHQKVQTIKGAASGLTYLHEQNILHRDLKSLNILLKGETAKLTDFGVSKTKEHTAKTMTGMVGSPSWMAPEVLRGETDYDKPADIYSLGLVLWEILHEKIPYQNLNVPQIVMQVGLQNKKETIGPDTPIPLKELMEKSWQEPKSRPTAPAFLESLASYQTTLPGAAPLDQPSSIPSAPPPTYNPCNPPVPQPLYNPEAPQTFKAPSAPPMTNAVQNANASVPVPESTFGAADWNTYFGDVGVEPPLPPDIDEILESPCPFWPDKKVQDTHFLCLIPKTVNGIPLTLDSLEDLVKHPKQGAPSKYEDYSHRVKTEHGRTGIERSYWALMTKDVLPNSRRKTYDQQKNLVESNPNYKLPPALGAAVVILMHTYKPGRPIYTDNKLGPQYTYTRCHEKVNNNKWSVIIGGLSAAGLGVIDYDFGGNLHDAATTAAARLVFGSSIRPLVLGALEIGRGHCLLENWEPGGSAWLDL